jgi:hypothetical protein
MCASVTRPIRPQTWQAAEATRSARVHRSTRAILLDCDVIITARYSAVFDQHILTRVRVDPLQTSRAQHHLAHGDIQRTERPIIETKRALRRSPMHCAEE